MSNTTRAIRIHETGAPEVMRWEEVSLPEPGSGEVQLRHTAVGLNFIDINHRSGAYPLKSLPAVIGMEGAGIIEAVGDLSLIHISQHTRPERMGVGGVGV